MHRATFGSIAKSNQPEEVTECQTTTSTKMPNRMATMRFTKAVVAILLNLKTEGIWGHM
jgi:hypothetical protein